MLVLPACWLGLLLLQSAQVCLGGEDVASLVGKTAQVSNEVKARRLDTSLRDYPGWIFKNEGVCGRCLRTEFDLDDLSFNTDESEGYDEIGDIYDGVPPAQFVLKFKCNNPKGCGSDDSPIPYEGVYCFESDDEEDCKEVIAEMKDTDDVALVDYTELRSYSCAKKEPNAYEMGCDCQKYNRSPQQCKVNDCRFTFGKKILNSMPASRRAVCAGDLGCREKDNCSFKCEEFCKMNDRCKWGPKGCFYKNDFQTASPVPAAPE